MLKLKKNFIIACIMLFASTVFATSSPTDNNVPPIANQNAYINIYKNKIMAVIFLYKIL